MRSVLEPHVVADEGAFLRVDVGDGGADVHLGDDSMMANHISGRDVWALLVRGAVAADWVVMAPDLPVCLTDPGQREHLPDGLDDDAVHVTTGAELLALVESG